MKALTDLPEGYSEIYSVNLQKNKKIAIFINLLAVVIAVAMVIPMHFVVPFWTLFDMSAGLGAYCVRFGILIVGMIAYMVLHEAVHGVAMKICGTKKVKYGFTGLYAFAGSEDYYDKKSYIFIALAPIVFLGVLLAVLNFLVPTAWTWVVYFIQIINVSGAAGDMFVSLKFLKMPKDILVADCGVGMCVYSKEGLKNED